MVDLLQSGLAWLHRQRRAHLVTDAVYHPAGSGAPVAVAVTASQIRVELLDGNGFPVSATVMNFIVTAADLPAEPAAGDRIEFRGRTHEVSPLGEEPCWRWTDASRLAYRIHSRDLGVALGSGS